MTEVIERIKAKEIERGKEKRNVPKLRFRGFEDEWIEKKLNEITKLTDGVHFTPEYVNNGIQFWSVETIVSNVKPKYITKEANKLANKRCKPEKFDILMTRIGTLAKSKVLTDDNAINIYVSVALIKSNKIFNSFFLKQYFDTNIYYKDFLSKALLTAVPKKINMDSLKQTKVKLPSLQEQKKIAHFFTLIDKKIEKQSEKVEALKTYKKGIMQKIFKQEIRFKDENGKEYPEWEKKRLGEILRERKLYCKKGLDYPHVTLSKDGIYDKSERYDRDFLVKNDNKDYKVTLKNDICYNPANLKFGVICRNKYGSAIFSPIYVTFEIINCNSIFIEHLVTRSNFINKVRKYEEGTVYERMSVKPENLLKFNIKIPDLREQTKIAEFLTTIDEKMDKEEKKLEELKVWKKGLLQKMFV